MKKLASLVVVVVLGGCAAQQQDDNRVVNQEAISKARAECIGETAIDAALDSNDFMYVRTTVRGQCRKYEHMIIDTYPAAERMTASDFLEKTFLQTSEEAAAFALNLLKDKKEYLNKFYQCLVYRTSKREAAGNMEEFRDISKSEISACYDIVMAPYIGSMDNEYSARRREKIINETTEMYVKILLEETAKVLKRKPPLAPPKQPKYESKGIQV